MESESIAHVVETYCVTVLFPIFGEEAKHTTRILTDGLVSTLSTYTLPPREEGERYAQDVVYPIIGQSNVADRLTEGLIKILEDASKDN
jgi:hypothetical protein